MSPAPRSFSKPAIHRLAVILVFAAFHPLVASGQSDIVIDGHIADLRAAVQSHLGSSNGGFLAPNPLGNIYTVSCAFVNGFDLRETLAFVDLKDPATLYLGYVVEGAIGDVDGDGYPDFYTGTQNFSCAFNGDQTGIGEAESYEAFLDLDFDLNPELIFVVTNNRVVQRRFGLPDRIVPGAAFAYSGPSLEVRIPLEDLLPPGTFACEMNLGMFCVAQFDGMGDDFSPRFQLYACENRFLVSSVGSPRTTLGKAVSGDLRITNAYLERTIVVSAVTFDDPAFDVAPEFRPALEAGVGLEPTFGSEVRHSASIPIRFTPDRPGAYRASAHLLSPAGDTLGVAVLTGEGRPIDYRWIYTDLYPDRRAEAGTPVILQLILADSVEVDSVVLDYGGSGALPATTKSMIRTEDDPLNDRYLVTLDASEFAAPGLVFHPRAFNGSYSTPAAEPATLERLRITSSNITFPFSLSGREYRMISIPLELANNTIVGVLEDDLGARDPSRWRMFTWIDSSYVELPNEDRFSFVPGRSYWLISSDRASLTTRPLTSISTPADSSFVLTLSSGLNMIANPFAFPVDWAEILSESALAAEILEPPRRWNSDDRRYDSSGVIQPFEGYWVRNWSTDPVVVRIPARSAGTEVAARATGRIASDSENDPRDWTLRLSAVQGDNSDPANFLGVSRQALDSRDPADQSELPPPPGSHLSLAFVHSSRSRWNGRFDADFRETPAGADWFVDVTASAGGGPVRITWDGLEDIPAGVRLTLVDRVAGESLDLRRSAGYTFTNASSSAVRDEDRCRFRLLAEVRDPASEPPVGPAVVLLGNQPNPFPWSTRITWETRWPGLVSVDVMDVGGRVVAVLERAFLPAGRHETVWSGWTASGFQAPDGVYFYRIRLGKAQKTGRMVRTR